MGATMMKSIAVIAAVTTCLLTPVVASAESLATPECSQWECVCTCIISSGSRDEGLKNPETGTPFFYPGGTKQQCGGHNGSACMGESFNDESGLIFRGKLSNCEWTLTPSDSEDGLCAIGEVVSDEAGELAGVDEYSAY